MGNTIRGLPRYYVITALAVLILLAVAGGLIGYRLAVNTLIDRVNGEAAAFAKANYTDASKIANGSGPTSEFQKAVQDEMGKRDVVKLRVYDDQSKVMFSTDASEIGQHPSDVTLSYWYGESLSSRLTHYDTFDTGSATLNGRDILSTRIVLDGRNYYSRGSLEIYSDVTSSQQEMMLTDAIVTGGIVLVLAGLLVAAIVLPRKPESV